MIDSRKGATREYRRTFVIRRYSAGYHETNFLRSHDPGSWDPPLIPKGNPLMDEEKYRWDTKTARQGIDMKYRVHRFVIDMSADQQRLEQFLNNLEGEVVSIIPNIAKTSLFQIYGITRKIDFLFIVEKVKNDK